jgi:tripartite-type tricarboxylate transporter receptor subunit TctC
VAVGGGSAPGGHDHLTPMLLAQTAGVDPKQVNYVSYDGGGELLAAAPGKACRGSRVGTADEFRSRWGSIPVTTDS